MEKQTKSADLKPKQVSGRGSEENAQEGRLRSKYGNIKTKVDGIEFDSKKEAAFYMELKVREKAGEVKDITLQPRFELQPKFDKDGTHYRKIEYVADFMYEEDGKIIVVDVKGKKTDVYKLKRKLFEYQYPELTIKEI